MMLKSDIGDSGGGFVAARPWCEKQRVVLVEEVRRGLTMSPKTLAPQLLYDDVGSQLFERITRLPEYYLTRVERSILEAHADEIVLRALDGEAAPLTILELGAGSGSKTEIILRAVLRRQAQCLCRPGRHLGRRTRARRQPVRQEGSPAL